MKRIKGMDTNELISKVVDGELATAVELACKQAVAEKLKEPGIQDAVKQLAEHRVNEALAKFTKEHPCTSETR